MKYKRLFGKLERSLRELQGSADGESTVSAILHRLVDDFHDDLGLVGGRIYVRRDNTFVLREEYPSSTVEPGFVLPADYGPIRQVLQQGFALHDPGDPGVDPEIEQRLGVTTFATIRLDGQPQQIVAFSLRDRSDREHVIYTLNTIRHVINIKLAKERLENRVAEVREIQLSMLPSAAPEFADYDIFGCSSPAEEVGGDLYDYLPVSERSLGIAVVDSAGHGLPAALQARDAIVGLRMGVEERLRITATIEKLNRVVSRSALSSRFISLFYCEVEPNGNMVYCNAGATPPLLLRDGSISELRQGGLVLGPNPSALYERGYTSLTPGSVLLFYTDGITEAEDAEGEMFEVARLRRLLRSREWTSAEELVREVYRATRDFSKVEPPVDDQTVVAVIRRRVSERTRRRESHGSR